MRYLTTVVQVSAAHGVSVRNERELRTLTDALNALLMGDVTRAADIIMLRFQAIELAATSQDWSSAKFLELSPQTQVSSLTEMEKEAITKQKFRDAKLAKLLAPAQGERRSWKGGPGGDQQAAAPPRRPAESPRARSPGGGSLSPARRVNISPRPKMTPTRPSPWTKGYSPRPVGRADSPQPPSPAPLDHVRWADPVAAFIGVSAEAPVEKATAGAKAGEKKKAKGASKTEAPKKAKDTRDPGKAEFITWWKVRKEKLKANKGQRPKGKGRGKGKKGKA